MPGMKGRFRDIVKRFKERQASQNNVAPEAAPAESEPPRPKFGFRFPSFGNRRKAETKAPEESGKRAPRPKALLLFGLLGIAVALGVLFLAPRMIGGRGQGPFAPPPPPPQPFSSPLPPAVPALPATPGEGEVSPTPPRALDNPSEEREASVPVPVPKKARNPFGDPESQSPGSSAPGSPSGPSAVSASLPPPPLTPKELPPLPLPPTGAPREQVPTQPPMPEVACLAVFLGKEASAVVRVKGFEGVVSVGEAVPGVGKLIEVRPDGCVIAIGKRKLAVSLEGEKRWK